MHFRGHTKNVYRTMSCAQMGQKDARAATRGSLSGGHPPWWTEVIERVVNMIRVSYSSRREQKLRKISIIFKFPLLLTQTDVWRASTILSRPRQKVEGP